MTGRERWTGPGEVRLHLAVERLLEGDQVAVAGVVWPQYYTDDCLRTRKRWMVTAAAERFQVDPRETRGGVEPVNHQPEFAAACVTASAERAIEDGAVAMAWTAIDAALDGEARERLLRTGD